MSDIKTIPYVNKFGLPSIMIEGDYSEKSYELMLLKNFYDLYKQEDINSKISVSIISFEREELAVPRHQLPIEFRQDDTEVIALDKVPASFKKKIRGIIVDTVPPPPTQAEIEANNAQ